MLLAQRGKTPRMPSGEVQNYSYIQRRPLENYSIARACLEEQELALGKKQQRTIARRKDGCGTAWLTICNSCLWAAKNVIRSIEILPRLPSDDAKKCASPGNMSAEHMASEKIRMQ